MVKFPVTVNDKNIEVFENANGVDINIFGHEDYDRNEGKKRGVYPLRMTRKKKGKVISLLTIDDEEKQHYCLIADKSKLFASQTSKHKGNRYFCDFCVNGFHSEESLDTHIWCTALTTKR
jgi:hypothetical protein